jgi:Cupin-like domain
MYENHPFDGRFNIIARVPSTNWTVLLQRKAASSDPAMPSCHYTPLDSLIDGGTPVIIPDTPAIEWHSVQHWSELTTEELIVELEQLHDDTLLSGVLCSNRREFVYENKSRPLHSDTVRDHLEHDIPLSGQWTCDDMSVRQFITESAVPHPQISMYYSHELTSPKGIGKSIQTLMSPREWMWESCHSENKPHSSTIWMGSASATMHYDPQHNLFVQLRGRKRFYLLDPKHIDTDAAVHLFPLMHASDRQSQSDYYNVTSHIDAIVADLYPGQVLFLPAYWLHRVEPLDDFSMSVNVWVDSEPSRIHSKILEMPVLSLIPTSHSRDVAGIMQYVRQLMESSGHGEHLRQLWHQRYGWRDADFASKFPHCSESDSDVTTTKRTCGALAPTVIALEKVQKLYPQMLDSIMSVRNLVSSIRNDSIERIVMMDLVEKIISFAVGPHNVCQALKCLRLP